MPLIKRVDRHSEIFRGRSISVIGISGATVKKSVIPVPDTTILCDVCNDEITTPKINLLYLSKREKHPYGTLCEDCRQKYHGKVEVVDA